MSLPSALSPVAPEREGLPERQAPRRSSLPNPGAMDTAAFFTRARRWRRLDLVERESRACFIAAALAGAREIAEGLDSELARGMDAPFFRAIELRDRVRRVLTRLSRE